MFSCGTNSTEAARDPWCCQLCVEQVSALSAQCCSHLRSWQSTVVLAQRSHFSIAPLSLIPVLYLLFFILFDTAPLVNRDINCLPSFCLFVPAFFFDPVSPVSRRCPSSPPLYIWCQPSTQLQRTIGAFACVFYSLSLKPLSTPPHNFHLSLYQF